MTEHSDNDRSRIDKWLWVARFYKTRALAAAAVSGGKVHLEGQRTKPGKDVKPGTRLRIRKGSLEWDIIVKGITRQRRPASEARLLYEETEDSLRKRELILENRRQDAMARPVPDGRPTKRDRRQLERVTKRHQP